MFPETSGLIHEPAVRLVERLKRDGIRIWYASAARASHPPPNGARHFVNRALACGRARILQERDLGAGWFSRAMEEARRGMKWSLRQIVANRLSVGMRWWQIPGALLFALSYHSLIALSSLLTTLLPTFMYKRFQL